MLIVLRVLWIIGGLLLLAGIISWVIRSRRKEKEARENIDFSFEELNEKTSTKTESPNEKEEKEKKQGDEKQGEEKKKNGLGCGAVVLIIIAVISLLLMLPFFLPDSSSSEEKHLNASVSYDGINFHVTNNDNFDWTNVEMTINLDIKNFKMTGYTLFFNRIEAKTYYRFGAMLFTRADGTRFNPFITAPKSFSIKCDQGQTVAVW